MLTKVWRFWCRTKAKKTQLEINSSVQQNTAKRKQTLLKIHPALAHQKLPLSPLASYHDSSSSFSAPLKISSPFLAMASVMLNLNFLVVVLKMGLDHSLYGGTHIHIWSCV